MLWFTALATLAAPRPQVLLLAPWLQVLLLAPRLRVQVLAWVRARLHVLGGATPGCCPSTLPL